MEIRKFLYLEKKKENFPSWINKKQRGYNDSYASKKIYFSISVPLDPNIFIYPFKGYSCGISTIYLFLENVAKLRKYGDFDSVIVNLWWEQSELETSRWQGSVKAQVLLRNTFTENGLLCHVVVRERASSFTR